MADTVVRPEPIDLVIHEGLPSDFIPPSDFIDPSDIIIPPRIRNFPINLPPPTTATPTKPIVLAATAPRAPQSLLVSAEGALINLMYGRVLAQPKIFAVGATGTDLVLGLLWGKGECSSVVNVYANKTALTGSEVTSYVGDQTQTADAWLASAIAGYSDDLKGYCYSVVKISQVDYTSIPKFTAVIDALLVFDPRDSSTAFSKNPALHFRHLALLAGLSVDDTSIKRAAESCDWNASGNPRREAGVVFDQPSSIDALLATLAEYAGCFYVRDAGTAKLVLNRPIYDNLLTDSRDLTGYGVTFTPLVTFDQVGLDGLAASATKVEDDDATNTESLGTNADVVTVAADSNILSVRAFLLKDAETVKVAVRLYRTGGVQASGVQVRTDTGALSADGGSNPNINFTAQQVKLGDLDWWEVIVYCDGDGAETDYYPQIIPAVDSGASVRPTTVGDLEIFYNVDPTLLLGTPPMYKIAGAGDVVASFTDVETDATRLKILKDSLTIRKISTENQPNRVITEYTDTTSIPWRRAFAPTPLPGGEVRTTRLILPGIHSFAQAKRQAIERLNYYTVTDLEAEFVAFDDSLKLEAGDVFDLTHADGLTSKQFKSASVEKADEVGHWFIAGREFDPAIFSNEALTDPTFNDTTLPDPGVVPDAPVPSLLETNYQLQNETFATRIDVTWAAVTDYVYSHEFEVRALIGTDLIWTVRTTELKAAVGPLKEAETYTIELRVIGAGGITGAKGSANLLAQGKQNPPTFPGGAQLRGNEAGGRVFLNWDAADDDIWNYEIRFGGSGQAWAAMTTLSQTDALYYTAETVPEGTWDFKIRAIDSVGVESSNEITLTGLVVTSDADSFAQTDATVAVDTVTNMTLSGNDYMPDGGTSWDTLFPTAMNGFTNPLVTYGGSFATQVVSLEHDLGAIVSANFQFSTNVQDLVGVAAYTMQISDTSGGPWDDYNTLSVNASGRYARLKIDGTGTDRWVLRPEYFHIVALVITINKEGEDTSNAGSAKTITLDAEYSKVVTIQITPQGTTGEDLTGVVDNVILGPGNTTFDVFIYDGGTQVAKSFYWTARVLK